MDKGWVGARACVAGTRALDAHSRFSTNGVALRTRVYSFQARGVVKGFRPL